MLFFLFVDSFVDLLNVQESGNGKKNELTAATEALRADLDRVNRQVTGLYDVVGQWEVNIKQLIHYVVSFWLLNNLERY
jgi:hypothetical protein